MSNREFTATRTMLANAMATAGAELLEYMAVGGALAAIPNTEPQQYVVAGTLPLIAKLLPPAASVPPLTAPAPLTDELPALPESRNFVHGYGAHDMQQYARAAVRAALAQAASAPQQSELSDDQWIFDLAAKHESRGKELFGPITFSSTAIVDFVREVLAKAAPAAPVQTAEPQKIEAWCERDGDEWVIYAAESPTGQYIAKHMKERHGVDVFALPPQVAAPVQAEQAQAEPVAWMHEDGRVVTASTMAGARKDGGAMLSSLRGYTIPLYATPALPAQAEAVRAAEWISVEDRLPEKECLAIYVTPSGKQRPIRAKYVRQFQIEAEGDDCETEYNDADDTFYIKAGWLECIDNWGEYSSCYVTEGIVTHWMPLPAAPSTATSNDTGAQGDTGGAK